MAVTQKSKQTIQDIYGTHLGRAAADEGLDYWGAQLDAGGSIADVIKGIQSGSEYKERQNVLTNFGNANQGSKPSEAYIDSRVAPGGGILDPTNINAAPTYAADNTWAGTSSPKATTGNMTHTDELADIMGQLQIGANSPNAYNTAANANTGNYQVGVTHDAAGNPLTGGGNVTITPNPGDQTTQPVVGPIAPVPGTGTGTGDTTKGWWEEFADAQAFKDFLTGSTGTGSNDTSQFDQFLQFMTALQGMGGFGGGSGWGYGGYGGFAPGGVRPNVGLNNIMNALNSFKNIGSTAGNAVTTGAANLS